MGSVHQAKLARVAPLADGVIEYTMALDEPITFRPGQFISLEVGRDSGGNPILRSYSLASSPGRAEASIIIKVVPGGLASGWFQALPVGSALRFTGPMGFFVLDLAHAGDVVFGATGVGITPVRPMLEELLARKETGRVLLFWGNRHPADLFWLDELRALAQKHPRFDFRLHVSRPSPEWSGASGRITTAITSALGELKSPTFYLVGNGAMIKDVKAELVARGVDRKRQIRNEAFFD